MVLELYTVDFNPVFCGRLNYYYLIFAGNCTAPVAGGLKTTLGSVPDAPDQCRNCCLDAQWSATEMDLSQASGDKFLYLVSGESTFWADCQGYCPR